VEAGAELRTSVTAVDVIKEGKAVRGVVTDGGEELRCRLLIDAEGVQNLLARKAGIRRTYRPEAIELCLLYDFKMSKRDIDEVCGYQIEYYWAMPEEKMIAPLGQGSAVYIFPYRESIHMTIGRFLKAEDGVAPLAKVLDEYYEKFFQVDRWREMYAPRAELRARIWDTCPIYAGLYEDMRSMPTFGDGMLLIGDAAGLEAAAQIRALVHLAQYGRQTMGDLAEGLQITMASATGLIKPLVALGYVVRTHDDDDRRVVWVELSPQAQSMADTILAARRLEVERALAGMDDVSCRHFLEGLERLAGRQP
jgi:DNA-binding MarR family transcriptional regulator